MVPLATVMFRLLNTWFGFRLEPYCLKAWRTHTACWRRVHSDDCWVCRLRGDARTSGEAVASGRSGVALASLQHIKHSISAHMERTAHHTLLSVSRLSYHYSHDPRHSVPFSSPLTTQRATVETLDPGSKHAGSRPLTLNTTYGIPVRTSEGTHYVSATEPNRLMLFGETVAVY
jgi:hypothetical protein